MTSVAYVGLGGNLGPVERLLEAARGLLADRLAQGPLKISPLFESEAWGLKEQPDFLNQVVSFCTRLGPEETLQGLFDIEAALGRTREKRWGPRTLDLDLLAWEQDGEGLTLQTARLCLPHPRLHLRRFVLVPLAALAPSLLIPGRKTVAELLADCDDAGWVKPWKDSD